VPILAAIKTELDKARPGILPKSLFGQAVEYASKLWPRLIVYVTNGILEIDQNLCENVSAISDPFLTTIKRPQFA
jgi:hypothetical protein